MAKTKTVKKTKVKPKSKFKTRAKSRAKPKKVAAKPVVRKSARPWQGTTMGVLAAVDAAATLLLGFILLFGGSFINGMMGRMQFGGMNAAASGMMMGIFAGMGLFLALFLLAVGVLDIFISRGFFEGKFWAVALTSFFVGLSVLGSIFQIFTSNVDTVGTSLVGLAVGGFIAYLCYTCWISPFYRK
jgi:hypothetical protein